LDRDYIPQIRTQTVSSYRGWSPLRQ